MTKKPWPLVAGAYAALAAAEVLNESPSGVLATIAFFGLLAAAIIAIAQTKLPITTPKETP